MDVCATEQVLEIGDVDRGKGWEEGSEECNSLNLLAAWYFGKLLGRLPFGADIFRCARQLLSEGARLELDAALMRLIESEAAGSPVRPIIVAMNQWEEANGRKLYSPAKMLMRTGKKSRFVTSVDWEGISPKTLSSQRSIQATRCHGIWRPLIPNATTIEAMREARAGNLRRASNIAELKAALDADD